MNKKNYFLTIIMLFILNNLNAQFNLIKNFGNYTSKFYVHNNKLYFSAKEIGTNNTELWVYNSNLTISSTNPKMLVDLDDDANSGSYPKNFIDYNGKLFFSNNNYLYSYDDNQPISATNPQIIGNRGNGLIVYNNKLYYEEASQYPNSWLWVYDDNLPISTTNPKKLIDNEQINSSSLRFKFQSIIYNNKLYYCGTNSNNQDFELYVYDDNLPISSDNPIMVSDINSGTTHASIPNDFIVYQNKIYFTADDGTGDELWSYDEIGTPLKVYDLDTSAYGGYFQSKVIFDNNIYFSAHNSLGIELWKYNETDNVQLVADIYQGSEFSIPQKLTIYQDKLFFNADNGINGREIWYYNPNISISQINPKLIDVFDGSESGIDTQNDIIVYNNNLYFSGKTSSNNYGLYQINSSTLETIEVTSNIELELYPNPSSKKIILKINNGKFKQIQILNSIGQIVSSKISENQKEIIEFSNKGIYYIKVRTNDNRLSIKKVIIQ